MAQGVWPGKGSRFTGGEAPDATQPSLAICCCQGKIMVPQASYFRVTGWRNLLLELKTALRKQWRLLLALAKELNSHGFCTVSPLGQACPQSNSTPQSAPSTSTNLTSSAFLFHPCQHLPLLVTIPGCLQGP